jgi:hypothetical protein
MVDYRRAPTLSEAQILAVDHIQFAHVVAGQLYFATVV